jgi:3',5'-cyclic-nucleotide phosphodiesterase
MIDNSVLLDAGAMTRGLSVDEQIAIDHIFVSHAHLDHVRDLGLLAPMRCCWEFRWF